MSSRYRTYRTRASCARGQHVEHKWSEFGAAPAQICMSLALLMKAWPARITNMSGVQVQPPTQPCNTHAQGSGPAHVEKSKSVSAGTVEHCEAAALSWDLCTPTRHVPTETHHTHTSRANRDAAHTQSHHTQRTNRPYNSSTQPQGYRSHRRQQCAAAQKQRRRRLTKSAPTATRLSASTR